MNNVTKKEKQSLLNQHNDLKESIKNHENKNSDEFQIMNERLHMLEHLLDDLEIDY